ncbi:hypothetical protein DSO57_1022046 [Entomophthora muscae]|uniref:Uncharacterized protein n=1 Tax=Entomophthora muscae TaxID=34485 RepID=A0ACC2RHU6_9FUNG|nr:hypothetical protein DSO57_1022046 [Entomophthora muscae]
MAPPSTPSPAVILVAGSQWNSNHLNSFAELEEVIQFESSSSPLSNPKYDWVTVEKVPDSPTGYGYTAKNAKVLDSFLNLNAHDEAIMSMKNFTSESPMVAHDLESSLMSPLYNSPMDV